MNYGQTAYAVDSDYVESSPQKKKVKKPGFIKRWILNSVKDAMMEEQNRDQLIDNSVMRKQARGLDMPNVSLDSTPMHMKVYRAWSRAGKPGDMRDHMRIGRVVVVVVSIPVRRADVDFDVAAKLPCAGLDKERGIEELGAGLKVPLAGVEHRDGLVAGQGERGWTIMRVEPETLKMAFAPVESGAVTRAGLAHGRWVRGQPSRVRVSERKKGGERVHACLPLRP